MACCIEHRTVSLFSLSLSVQTTHGNAAVWMLKENDVQKSDAVKSWLLGARTYCSLPFHPEQLHVAQQTNSNS